MALLFPDLALVVHRSPRQREREREGERKRDGAREKGRERDEVSGNELITSPPFLPLCFPSPLLHITE